VYVVDAEECLMQFNPVSTVTVTYRM